MCLHYRGMCCFWSCLHYTTPSPISLKVVCATENTNQRGFSPCYLFSVIAQPQACLTPGTHSGRSSSPKRGGRRVYTSSAPLSLPAGIKNPRIRPFISGAFVGTVPAEIPPLNKEDETKIVRTLLNELNEKFCVNLDCHPSFERSVPPPFNVHSASRTVFIGASNMGKIAKAAAENGHMVVDLTSSGWTPKPCKIEKLCETLEKRNLTEMDTVVIDPMSNSAYLGTAEDGLPIPDEKSEEDRGYHLLGDLQLAPPSAFKNCLKNMEKMLAFVGGG
jgi:hypothetical protein